jgi:membrane associated rhomboid family serine protease
MHAGFIHLFMNLYVQFMIGLGFERRWNWWRMGIIYMVAGVGGNLLSCIAKPQGVSVGASGALIGIIGARVTDIILRWTKMPQQARISNVISLVMLLFFTMIMTFTSSYVDWASHLGGLIVGFFVGFAVFAHELDDKRFRTISLILGVSLSVIYYIATILVFALVTKV